MAYSPLVSVVIPSHNRAKLVKRAAQSVLNQSYTNLECIVVDDASTDDTMEVLAEIEDERFRVHCHSTNRHASAARNTGISLAKGQFIAFLDDDDRWLPTKIEKQIALLSKAPKEVGLVYCWADYVDADDNVARTYRPTLSGYIFPRTIEDQPIGNSSALLVRREVIENIGGFDESLPRGNDSDFIRRVCEKYCVDYVPEILIKVHFDHGYERIGTRSERSIRNFVRGQQAILDKFDAYQADYPQEFARVYAKIANYSASVGDWPTVLQGYRCALRLSRQDPYIYKMLLRSAAKFAVDISSVVRGVN